MLLISSMNMIGRCSLLNLKKLTSLNVDIKIRMPIIKGINNDQDSLEKTAAYLLEVGIDQIELIPYHNYGEAKYEKTGQDYQLKGMSKFSEADLQEVKKLLGRADIKTNSEGEFNDHSRTGIHRAG